MGDKRYVKASLDRIRRLAADIPDRAAFEHALKHAEESSQSLILSPRQARTILDYLELNRFFAKFAYNCGECFYSHRLDHAALAAAVAKRKLSKMETIAVHRELDRTASLEIQERIENISVIWSNAAWGLEKPSGFLPFFFQGVLSKGLSLNVVGTLSKGGQPSCHTGSRTLGQHGQHHDNV